MAVIKINSFGGEFPRMEARGLPPGTAQVNKNLMATSNDFRPLYATGPSVKSAVNGAKSLYRFQRDVNGQIETNLANGWESSTEDLNYCRGQINDDQTERTYVSDNSGVHMPYVQTNAGTKFLLGVPPPKQPSVSLLTTTKFTAKKAKEWANSTLLPALREAVKASLIEDQFLSRFRIFDTIVPNETLGSGQGNSIAGITKIGVGQDVNGWYEYFPTRRFISPSVFDISQRGVYEPWHLMVRVPGQLVTPEGFANTLVNGAINTSSPISPGETGNPWFAPVPCLPFWGQFCSAQITVGDVFNGSTPHNASPHLSITNTGFAKEAKAIKNPVTGLRLLTDWQISKLSTRLAEYFAPPPATDERRTGIDACVRNMEVAMYMMVKNYKPIKGINPAAAQGIIVPNVPANETDEAFATRMADWKAAQASAVASWVAAREKCEALSHEIESEYFLKKNEIDTEIKSILNDIPLEKTDDTPQGLLYLDNDSVTESLFFVATFVSSVGEESAPSPPSRMLTRGLNDLVAIARPDIPAPISTAGANGLTYDIAKWRIYCSKSGTGSTAFQFAAELGINDTWSSTPYANGWGKTGLVAPGYGDEKKWRDIIGNYVVYNNDSRVAGLNWSTVGFEPFVNPKHLRIGDTVTQISATPAGIATTPPDGTITLDQILANDYAITKTWNGHAWTTGQVPTISSSGATKIVGEKTYVYGLSADQLVGELVTTTWALPPYRMDATNPDADPLPIKGSSPFLRGLVNMANGITLGFIDNFIAPCDPYHPYAYPPEYQIPLDYPIVGLCAFGQTAFAGTVGVPYFISGSDSMSLSAQKLNDNQACVSARSMVAAVGGVFYASPDGYCFASQNGVDVATAALFSHEEWTALKPETIFATVHDGVLYFWATPDSGQVCYGLDMVARKLTRHDMYATAVFDDIVTDAAFVAYQGGIRRLMDAAAGRAMGTYKTGKITLPAQTPFAWIKVMSDFADGPVAVNWYADGVRNPNIAVRGYSGIIPTYSAIFTSTKPQRLPPGRYLEHELEVVSKSRVTSVVIAGNTQELQSE